MCDMPVDEQSLPELSSQLLTILTTEHYNLQMGRSMTVADANGRCTLFIGAVSGASTWSRTWRLSPKSGAWRSTS